MRDRWHNINPFMPTKARQLSLNIYLTVARSRALLAYNVVRKRRKYVKKYIFHLYICQAFLNKNFINDDEITVRITFSTLYIKS